MEFNEGDLASAVVFTLPEPNFEMVMGEGSSLVMFRLTVPKTIGNRVKYWLFCHFFPFKLTRWD